MIGRATGIDPLGCGTAASCFGSIELLMQMKIPRDAIIVNTAAASSPTNPPSRVSPTNSSFLFKTLRVLYHAQIQTF